MNTINEKLEQFKVLYQQRVSDVQEIQKQIFEYEKRKREIEDLEFKLQLNRLTIYPFLSIVLATGYAIGSYVLFHNDLLCIKIMLIFGFANIGITYALEKIGLTKKFARIFQPKKYQQLDELNTSLEKVNIDELKQQLQESIDKEKNYKLALQELEKEADKLGNISSEEEINKEYQRQWAANEMKRMMFYQTHVLTEEESIRLDSIMNVENIGYQKKIGEMKQNSNS